MNMLVRSALLGLLASIFISCSGNSETALNANV